MNQTVAVIGVPTSAGAFAPGQEQAPCALRDAGLLRALERGGAKVHDRGDRERWRWRPDREHPRAQHLGRVVEIVQDTARRVEEAVRAEEITLVLGGDCTVGIGTVAGHVRTGERVGLVYLDAHADLNVPASVTEGALDWMGMAHLLGEEGACAELVGAGDRTPLLEDDHVVLLGWGPEQSTAFEREAIARRGLDVVAVDEVRRGPEAAAARALALIEDRCDRLLVHFDVDVIDFTDVPLSENCGRNEGLSFDAALRVLAVLLASPRLAGLTVAELNPDHAEKGADSVERFAEAVADALTGAAAR